MIKISAARTVAAVLLVGGLVSAPLLDNNDGFLSPAADPIAIQAPTFRISWLQGDLTLSGHTVSQQHEQALLQVAESSYPKSRVETNFQALGIVPDYWADTTAQVLYLLQKTGSAEATVSTKELKIRAVIIDQLGWNTRLEALRTALSIDVAVSTDTILVDPNVNLATVCERAYETFESGPINFEESSIEFRSSAYPRLDRLIALAKACHDSRISITGHTDSSGNAAWNQRLSVRRASAVGDYIASGGINRERLRISGVGSAEPIADDSTRYGRSINRRIEIVLTANY